MKFKIFQRKPDVEQDESSYSTRIEVYDQEWHTEPAAYFIGHGFTQGDADNESINHLLANFKTCK
jgi:hypothetical protein